MRHVWQATSSEVRSVRCLACGEHYDGRNYADGCPRHAEAARTEAALRLACSLRDDPCPLEVADGRRGDE